MAKPKKIASPGDLSAPPNLTENEKRHIAVTANAAGVTISADDFSEIDQIRVMRVLAAKPSFMGLA